MGMREFISQDPHWDQYGCQLRVWPASCFRTAAQTGQRFPHHTSTVCSCARKPAEGHKKRIMIDFRFGFSLPDPVKGRPPDCAAGLLRGVVVVDTSRPAPVRSAHKIVSRPFNRLSRLIAILREGGAPCQPETGPEAPSVEQQVGARQQERSRGRSTPSSGPLPAMRGTPSFMDVVSRVKRLVGHRQVAAQQRLGQGIRKRSSGSDYPPAAVTTPHPLQHWWATRPPCRFRPVAVDCGRWAAPRHHNLPSVFNVRRL